MALENPGPAWLFCPADRPERFEKAAGAADIVILDLEDGVAAADRGAARTALVDMPLDRGRTVVRVNAAGTADQQLDLEALARTRYHTVMLPECEAAQQVSALAPLDVVVLIESPLGALTVAESVRADNAVAAMWGAEDLFAALGGTANRHPAPGTRHPDGTYREVARHVRSQSLLAAKAHGRLALDSVYLDIKDLDGCATRSMTPSPSGSTPRLLSTPANCR